MKVLLLNPPSPENTEYVRVERCMQKKSAWAGSLWQPLPLMYAQAVLKEKGYETKLKDATAERMDYSESIDFVVKENPDFLVVNVAVPTIYYDSKFASDIKRRLKNVKTVAVGIPTIVLPSIVAKYEFDYAILGDVEHAVIDIVSGKTNPKFKIKNTEFVEHFVEDLDKLPFPVLDDLDLDKYIVPFTRERLMLIDPGRGCPFECTFCLVPATTKGVRFRTAKSFVDELERDHKQYKIRNFLFWIETATMNKKLMMAICDEIIKRKLKIKWMTPSRVDTVDKKLLNKMKQAGCWMISYGIESANQKILDSVKKRIKVEQIKDAIGMAHKAGIKVMGHVIIGLPGETRKTFEKTLEWLIKNNVDYCQFYCAVPYWKTELRKLAEEKGWIESDDPTKYEIDKAVMRNESLSSKEIEELRKYAFFKFYFRPKMVVKELINYRFNPLHVANLMKDGFYFFKSWVSSSRKPSLQ